MKHFDCTENNMVLSLNAPHQKIGDEISVWLWKKRAHPAELWLLRRWRRQEQQRERTHKHISIIQIINE